VQTKSKKPEIAAPQAVCDVVAVAPPNLNKVQLITIKYHVSYDVNSSDYNSGILTLLSNRLLVA
jgi:hypothetical protein